MRTCGPAYFDACTFRNPLVPPAPDSYDLSMNILFWIIVIIAVVLLVVGGVVEAVRFLLWIGIALVLIAVIAWAIRKIAGNKR